MFLQKEKRHIARSWGLLDRVYIGRQHRQQQQAGPCGPSWLGDAIVLTSEVPLLEPSHSLSALGRLSFLTQDSDSPSLSKPEKHKEFRAGYKALPS